MSRERKEGPNKGRKREDNWKFDQVKDPDERNGLSDILSMELEKDMDTLERRLKNYWKRHPDPESAE
ncbi:MAG: hypothetical protein DRN37_06165 [Thermoplasmata archaeon]|nr:MAG: hypothetical protein B6U90_07530 [Thermoplasmatales archaeon ex4484_6]RLF57627.1 MAG: hypothetical protein DRN37_06165 [Thermoplasmata archaeon]RLF68639.1 MAG: hypothetical protein DRN57_03370 [Thermoplasmata archaeon]HHD15419.1 hypothetical protein [Euryarchaeota archaeon]